MGKNKRNFIRIIVSAAMFAVVLTLQLTVDTAMPKWGWLICFAAVYAVIGYDVLFRSARNIARGKVFDENFLMALATVGAFCISEYVEAVAVMLFYQAGEFFQNYAVNKSRRSIAALMDICPETACLITPDGEKTVDPADVEVGSEVAVRVGEKVPIDGTVTDGSGYLDCAALTGESVPVSVNVGDKALSGAIVSGGALRIRTEKPYSDSTVSKILELVENASAKKAKAENFITRFAAVYTPAVVIAALLLAVVPPLALGHNVPSVWIDWATRALTFLVVSCPCALVISVPMSFFGGIGAASKNGILIKGGNYLELLNNVDTVVFDKTGTITKGKFEVTDIAPADGTDAAELVRVAAAVENCSMHPVARSVVAAAENMSIDCKSLSDDVRDTAEIAGMGVTATVNGEKTACGNLKLMETSGISVPEKFRSNGCGTVVYVARGGTFIGSLTVADGIKDDSVRAVGMLKDQGVKTVMLTGDGRMTAERVAEEVGVDDFCAELLPDGKVEKLEEVFRMAETGTKKRRGKVAFAGDGINDAPVLARADIGIAMGALGSDAAVEAADIVLMNDKLSQIVTARKIAKKTVGIVKQNIVFALAVKAAVLVLAAFGIANMWLAVFADVGVAVLAILNAMRALRVRSDDTTGSEAQLRR